MYSRAGRSSRTQVASNAETQFVFNTFSFLVWGALVMWMCAGFTMLESGSVRTKNASVICLKNIGLYAIAGLAYYFIGYNLMYVDVGSLIGSVTLFYGPSADEVALLAGQESARAGGGAAGRQVPQGRVGAADGSSRRAGCDPWRLHRCSAGFQGLRRRLAASHWPAAVDGVAMSNVAVNTQSVGAAGFSGSRGSAGRRLNGAIAGLASDYAAGATHGCRLLGVIIGAVGAFVFTVSWLLWTAIEKTIGVRVTYNVEQLGQDAAELGIEAYPEFVLMPEPDDTE